MITHEEMRETLNPITIEGAATFLRHLGSYQYEMITVLGSRGYNQLTPVELVENFNPTAPARKVGPVYFTGGPKNKDYKGNYLTFLVDKAMKAQFINGPKFVLDVIKYVEGVTAKLSPKRGLDHSELCALIQELHGTRLPVEHGLGNLGVCYLGYDLDELEDEMLHMGLACCDTCGLWVRVEDWYGGACYQCYMSMRGP